MEYTAMLCDCVHVVGMRGEGRVGCECGMCVGCDVKHVETRTVRLFVVFFFNVQEKLFKNVQGWNPTSFAIHSYFLLFYSAHMVHSFADLIKGVLR